MIVKRCPTRSMRIVGDIAQASSPGAARSWDAALAPNFPKAWELVQLSVICRTPAEIEPIAIAVLEAGSPSTCRRTSARSP